MFDNDVAPSLTYVLAILSVGYLINSTFNSSTYKLRQIPTIGGPTFPVLSFFGAFNIIIRGPAILRKADSTQKCPAYKYASLKGWTVIVSGTQLIEELARAPEDVLSMEEVIRRSMQTEYTMGHAVVHNPYHADIVRTMLTRNLEKIYPAIYDEVIAASKDYVALVEEEWVTLPVTSTIAQIMSRLAWSVLAKLQFLGRVPEYRAIVRDFAFSIMKGAAITSIAPELFQPLVGRLVSTLHKDIKKCSKYTGPIITERLRMRAQYGDDWSDKPSDFLQSLVDLAPEEELNVSDLTARILAINLAAIQTTSTALTTQLLYLASNPAEYLYPLREEVDSVVAEYGWSRTALQRMRKLDSFAKECSRVVGLGAVAFTRLAMRDFTFSNGLFIPAGTYIGVSAQSVHYDDSVYPGAAKFDPWRFSNMREGNGEGTRHQLVSLNAHYMPFGCGRHAWFFAAAQVKTMLAYIVANYDVKLESELVMSPIRTIEMSYIPNGNARVMFRKRQA